MTTEVIEPFAHGRDCPTLWPFSLIVGEMDLQDLGANKGTDLILWGNEMVSMYPGNKGLCDVYCMAQNPSTGVKKRIKKKTLESINSYENEGAMTEEMKTVLVILFQ